MSYTLQRTRAQTGAVRAVGVLGTGLAREDERKLGPWTRFYSFCSLRNVDVLQSLSKTSVQGDSQPLFYFLNYPCRRAEIVGLVIGTTCTSSAITYHVDDGTAIIECTLTAQQSDIASSPIIKGKRKAEAGELPKPGCCFDDMFPVGSILRVLGFIEEHFRGGERYLRVDEIKRVSRLSEEAEHAIKARELRLTTYTERLDTTLASHRIQMEQAEASRSFAMLAGSSRLTSSPATRSSNAPSSDISFFLEDETMATPRPSKRALPMSQTQSAFDPDADEPSYANTTTLLASQTQMPKPQARLHAPHRLKDEQLHVDSFNSYLYDYFCRHASEVVTYQQLYTSKNFSPLARRLVQKLAADGLNGLESDAAKQLVSELTRISQRSETKAVDCLYLRTITQLCSSMYIAPSPTANDAYQFVTVDTLGPTLLSLLRNRPRTPHELVQVLRRGEERWQWARTERVQEILREMVRDGSVKPIRDGRFAAVS